MVTATGNPFQDLARQIQTKMQGARPWIKLSSISCAVAVHVGQLGNPRRTLCGQVLTKITADTPRRGDWLCANCRLQLEKAGIAVPLGLRK